MATGTCYVSLPTQPPYFVSNGTLTVLPSTSFPTPPGPAPTQTKKADTIDNTERTSTQNTDGDLYMDLGNS